ncbi:NAD(P)H-binding protein [Microlunatus lacustris]
MGSTVLVTGASGFVGSHLATALVEAGHQVRAMTRHPDRYDGAGEPVPGDVADRASLDAALTGVDVAYYLVHSLDSDDFVDLDAQAARNFSAAAAQAGVERIIYLGGLGREDQDLSDHLRSRRQVEQLLGTDGVPVTVLRAAIVIGHGGISWEITRQLVAHLPAMVVPRWATTKTQPIALADVVRYLVGVLEPAEARGRVFEIGGTEVLTYAEMMQRVAKLHHRRVLPMVTVPLLTPRLSSHWLAFVTDVDTATARNLVDSMSNEVVVHEQSIRDVVPGEPMDYTAAVQAAYDQRAAALGEDAEPASPPGSAPVRDEHAPRA